MAEKVLISVWVALADVFGYVGEVEFDRPPAACLEIREQRPIRRAKYVARMGLAVQQLLGAALLDDRSSPVF